MQSLYPPRAWKFKKMDLLKDVVTPGVLLNEPRGKRSGYSNDPFRIENTSTELLYVQPTWKTSTGEIEDPPLSGKANFHVEHNGVELFPVPVDYVPGSRSPRDPPPFPLLPGGYLCSSWLGMNFIHYLSCFSPLQGTH
jgi:hypothetical protein